VDLITQYFILGALKIPCEEIVEIQMGQLVGFLVIVGGDSIQHIGLVMLGSLLL